MLNYAAGGPAEGPTLLFVHPMGADLSFWDAVRHLLERDRRCIAVDLRGAGASPAAERPIRIEEHADDLGAFCDALGVEDVVIVGCAVGAMAAAVFAGKYARLCGGAVLSNPGFATRPEARENLARRAAAARAGGMAAVISAATDSAFAGCPDDDRRRDYVRRFASQDPVQYALQIEGMLDADTSPWLAQIASPTLIIAGGRDTLLPPDHAQRLREGITDAQLVLIPQGAHFIPYQRPVEFCEILLQHLL